jgi:hypothetical protein
MKNVTKRETYNVDKDLIFQLALTGQVEEFMEAAGYKGNIKL